MAIVGSQVKTRDDFRIALEGDARISVIAELDYHDGLPHQVKRLAPQLLIIIADKFQHHEASVVLVCEMMSTNPLPILMISSADTMVPKFCLTALNAGVLDVMAAPPAPATGTARDAYEHELRTKVVGFSKVPVVTRKNFSQRLHHAREDNQNIPADGHLKRPANPVLQDARVPRLIVIGSSTGGPPALESLLSLIPAPYSVPIAIVQHMAVGYTEGLAQWLSEVSGHRTILCDRTMTLDGSSIYIASDNVHLELKSSHTIGCRRGPRHGGFCPSVDVLFESAALHLNSSVVAILLTGMGGDGASGMATLHRKGARTFVQQLETCVVSSMPKTALKMNAATAELSIEKIGHLLSQWNTN